MPVGNGDGAGVGSGEDAPRWSWLVSPGALQKFQAKIAIQQKSEFNVFAIASG